MSRDGVIHVKDCTRFDTFMGSRGTVNVIVAVSLITLASRNPPSESRRATLSARISR